MVLDLILRVCLVLLFAGGPGDWTSFSLRAGSKTASAPKARRPDTASLILELSCVYSPGKPLAGFEPPGFDATNGYERQTRHSVRNSHAARE
jgi:hypothetical protein